MSRRRHQGRLLTDFAREALTVIGLSILAGLAMVATFYFS